MENFNICIFVQSKKPRRVGVYLRADGVYLYYYNNMQNIKQKNAFVVICSIVNSGLGSVSFWCGWLVAWLVLPPC